MRLLVINVARKPLMEPSVARNSLKWGTGGININASRIRTSDQLDIHTRGESGMKGIRSSYEGGNYYEIPDRHQTPGQKIGRWPPNLILQHKPGCQLVGSQQMGSGEYVEGEGRRPGGFGDVGADKGDNKPNGPIYGTETVDVWKCEVGCPAADLDDQGEGRSAYPGNPGAAQANHGKPVDVSTAVTDFKYIAQHGGLAYSDTGGTSRYFKQVRSTE